MVITRSQPATASANASPRARSAPWWTCTRSCGVNRAASRCQLPTSDIGQTSRVGAAVRLVRQQRQQLHRLAQAHVVGEHAAEPGAAEEVQPGQPALLVRAQLPVEDSGVATGREPLLGLAGQQVAEPAVGLDPLDRQAVRADAGPRGSTPRPSRSSSPTSACAGTPDELQPGGQPPRVQLDPLAAQPHQRRLQLGQLGQLLLGQHLAAEREVVAEVDDGVEADRRCTARPPARAGAGVDAVSRSPSRADGLVHQPGSRTPNPAVASVGAAVLRNRCAPSVSSARPSGRAVRSAPSSSG